MKITITENKTDGKNKKIEIPWMPESISFSIEGRTAEYDILNFGQIVTPTGKNLAEFSWEGIFPGESRRRVQDSWTSAQEIDGIMKEWVKKGIKLTLAITGTQINKDVILISYSSEIKPVDDYYYSVSFQEYESLTLTGKRGTGNNKKKVTVGKGDTLRRLAKKYLGSAKKYKLIYQANKKLIDSRNKKERKKHPKKKISKYTIYKGQVLIIDVKEKKTTKNSKVLELKKAINHDGYAKLKLDNQLNAALKSALKKMVLRKNAKGEVVKFVQKMVGVKQDGNYGKNTIAAVKKYQRNRKLRVDGMVGEETFLVMIR